MERSPGPSCRQATAGGAFGGALLAAQSDAIWHPIVDLAEKGRNRSSRLLRLLRFITLLGLSDRQGRAS